MLYAQCVNNKSKLYFFTEYYFKLFLSNGRSEIFALQLPFSLPFRSLDRGVNPESDSLNASRNRSQVPFFRCNHDHDPFSLFLVFSLRPTFLSLRAPTTAMPRKLRRYAALVLLSLDRQIVKIFSRILRLSRGSKGDRRVFLVPRFALNSIS